MKRKPDEGRYSKVTRRVWSSEDFRALSGPSKPNAQHLFFRFLTGPELGVIPGLFELRAGGIADELNWPVAGTRKCIQEIADRGMAAHDAVAGLVWVPRAINHNAPDNPNVVLGWRLAWKELPACALKERAREELRVWFEQRSALTGNSDWVKAFDKVTGQQQGHPSGNASPNPTTNQDPSVGGNPFPNQPPNRPVNVARNLSLNRLGNQEQDQDQDQEQDPQQQQDLDLEASARARAPDAAALRTPAGILNPDQVKRRALAILARMDAVHGGGGTYDFESFRAPLERLALKNAEDLERALRTYAEDPWVQTNRGKADPDHFIKRFERYVQGGLGGSVRAKRPEELELRDDLGVM